MSDPIDIKNVGVALIGAPSNWTSANISFQISDDNITWFDLVDDDGSEIRRTFKAGCAIVLDPALAQAVNYLKIRSGSRDGAVPQQTDAIITLFPV